MKEVSVCELIQGIVNNFIRNNTRITAKQNDECVCFVYKKQRPELCEEQLVKVIKLVGLNGTVELCDENADIDLIPVESDGGNFYIKNEYGTKCFLTKHSKIMVDKINEIIEILNKRG